MKFRKSILAIVLAAASSTTAAQIQDSNSWSESTITDGQYATAFIGSKRFNNTALGLAAFPGENCEPKTVYMTFHTDYSTPEPFDIVYDVRVDGGTIWKTDGSSTKTDRFNFDEFKTRQITVLSTLEGGFGRDFLEGNSLILRGNGENRNTDEFSLNGSATATAEVIITCNKIKKHGIGRDGEWDETDTGSSSDDREWRT